MKLLDDKWEPFQFIKRMEQFIANRRTEIHTLEVSIKSTEDEIVRAKAFIERELAKNEKRDFP